MTRRQRKAERDRAAVRLLRQVDHGWTAVELVAEYRALASRAWVRRRTHVATWIAVNGREYVIVNLTAAGRERLRRSR